MKRHESLRLIPFDEGGFAALIAEVTDARFLLQWAGPKYVFPLDAPQLSQTLAEARQPSIGSLAFSAVLGESARTVGHIQLMRIDREEKACTLGRVMIFKAFRGQGLGREMLAQALRVAFDDLGLDETRLSVFDFNQAAVSLYRAAGFSEYDFSEGAREFEGESWNLIRMKCRKPGIDKRQ